MLQSVNCQPSTRKWLLLLAWHHDDFRLHWESKKSLQVLRKIKVLLLCCRCFQSGIKDKIPAVTSLIGVWPCSCGANHHSSSSLSSSFQTATDSSSNSSQKREPAMHTLAPPNFCEARRHHCILGHFYEQHRPSDHYFLDQVCGTDLTLND